MKEMRFKANHGAEIWRAAFAFDPARQAIVLVAADKQGIDEGKFYKDLLKIANERFDEHLRSLEMKITALPKGATKTKPKAEKTRS